jgi:RNA polymerase sigma-70 factor (ECF subfamily)
MDPTAWERFVHLYGPLVYHWCRRAGLQDADAADVGQEVFRAVAAGIGGFRHDGAADSFRAWLRTIARNKVRDFGRRRSVADAAGGTTAQVQMQRVVDDPADPAEADPPEAPDEKALLYRRAVDLILAGYQEPTRLAFLRVVIDRDDPVDVARDLGLTVNAVYLAKSRIRKRLREEFSGLLDP